MPHGLLRKHTIGRPRRAPTKPIPPQDFEEDAKTYIELKIKAFYHTSADDISRARRENLLDKRKKLKGRSRTLLKTHNKRRANQRQSGP